jgi:Protein of unknown function (DUF3467)
MAEEEEEAEGFDEGHPPPEIFIALDQLAGVWANWADVRYSQHEFTIDFVRMDPREPHGIVVARVSSSSQFVMELIDTLNNVWHDWAKKAMPREVHGADGEQTPDSK